MKMYIFENFLYQCIIGDGDIAVPVEVKFNKAGVRQLEQQRSKLRRVKLTLTNFQKVDDVIVTNSKTTFEIDNEVNL